MFLLKTLNLYSNILIIIIIVIVCFSVFIVIIMFILRIYLIFLVKQRTYCLVAADIANIRIQVSGSWTMMESGFGSAKLLFPPPQLPSVYFTC